MRRRGAREPGGQGIQVSRSPLLQGSAEPAECSDSFRHPGGRAQENKVLRELEQRWEKAEPRDAAQSALSRRQPAGLCLPLASTSLLRCLGSARELAPSLQTRAHPAPPRARSPRPSAPRPLSRDSRPRGAQVELSKAEEARQPLARRQPRVVQANQRGGKGRVRSLARVDGRSSLLCGVPGQYNLDPGSLNVGFPGATAASWKTESST